MYNPFYILLAGIRAVIIVVSLLVFLTPYVLLTKLFIKNTPELAFKVRRAWVRLARFVLGIQTKVSGHPHSSHALYVCNHRSFSDPIVLAGYVDAYVIAKAEVANLPLIHTGAEMTGVIYVKRENKDSRTAVRERMVEILLQNKNVLVYPEGTTNNGFQTLPFKKGTFLEAAKNNIPVVPVVLEYKKKKDLWHKSSLIGHHFRQFGRLTTHCMLEIGPAIHNNDGLELANAAESWINQRIKEIHLNWANSDFHSTALKEQATPQV